jgi:hypothetical protein
MKSYHTQVNGWNWRTSFSARLSWPKIPKVACSPSHEDFGTRVNTRRFDFDHIIRQEHTREI